MFKKLEKGVLSLFFLCAGAGLLVGFTYHVLASPSDPQVVEKTAEVVYNTGLDPQAQQTSVEASSSETTTTTTQPPEGGIFKQNGCIQCHTISFYDITGGVTGPDLSLAYEDVPKRFGKSLEEFFKEPEGTMGDLLPTLTTAEDRQEILKLLTKATQKK